MDGIFNPIFLIRQTPPPRDPTRCRLGWWVVSNPPPNPGGVRGPVPPDGVPGPPKADAPPLVPPLRGLPRPGPWGRGVRGGGAGSDLNQPPPSSRLSPQIVKVGGGVILPLQSLSWRGRWFRSLYICSVLNENKGWCCIWR